MNNREVEQSEQESQLVEKLVEQNSEEDNLTGEQLCERESPWVEWLVESMHSWQNNSFVNKRITRLSFVEHREELRGK